MTPRPVTNVGASVLQRLLNLARERGVSRPFEAPSIRKIAVKVINHYGASAACRPAS